MKIFSQKNTIIFLYIILIYSLLTLITQEFLITDSMMFDYYKNKNLSENQIYRIMTFKDSFSWLSYFINIIIYLLKFFIISVIIISGLLLRNYNVKFTGIFNIVLRSEFTLVLYTAIQLVLLYIIGFNSINDLIFSSPGSILYFFDHSEIKEYMKLPLSSINIGQLIYFFVLTSFLRKLLQTKYWHSFKIIISSYGICFVGWLIIVSFIQLNFFS